MSRIIEGIKTKLLALLLDWRSRPGAIEKYLAAKQYPVSSFITGKERSFGPGKLRAAAVQMRLELISSPYDFAARIYDLVRKAVEEGAQLVAFPEDSATGLLGLIPGIEKLAAAAGDPREAAAQIGEGVKVADIFRFISPAVKRIYETTFSYLSRRFGVYIATGSAILPGSGTRMVNVGYLYGPDGQLIGTQEKCHFIPAEWSWGLATGDELSVFDTPWGKIGIPICMDATYFETFRILSLLGAEIIVVPSANPEEYNFWKAMRGIWPRVQESQVFGIGPAMVGKFLGLILTGRAGIFAPLALTPNGDGVLAQMSGFEEEGVVLADLDLVALRNFRREHGIEQGFNLDLYERYFPDIYQLAATQDLFQRSCSANL